MNDILMISLFIGCFLLIYFAIALVLYISGYGDGRKAKNGESVNVVRYCIFWAFHIDEDFLDAEIT